MFSREMICPWCRIFIVCVVACTDIVVYVYDMYVAGHANPVSYPAHIAGAITGNDKHHLHLLFFRPPPDEGFRSSSLQYRSSRGHYMLEKPSMGKA